MTRATIIVEKWSSGIGWQYDKGYSESDEDLALKRAHLMKGIGVQARVYRRTPNGPEVLYQSPELQQYPKQGQGISN